LINRKHSNINSCDQNEVSTIIACLNELKQKVACILKCQDEHSSNIKERIIFCILLEEIRKIEQKLDTPCFSLTEIKSEMIDINETVNHSLFGLQEIKNEVRNVEESLINKLFCRSDLENGITKLSEIVSNSTYGIPVINNEVRFIENTVISIDKAIHSPYFGLNEINNKVRFLETNVINIDKAIHTPGFALKEINNEVRFIENSIISINQAIHGQCFGINEMKNEFFDMNEIVAGIHNMLSEQWNCCNSLKHDITDIDTMITTINSTVNSQFTGLNEIKQEIIDISGLLTDKDCGYSELKNELKSIENTLSVIKANRPLSCNTDSVSICGKGVDNKISTVTTDTHSVLTTLPGASAFSQIGRLYSVATDFVLNVNNCNSVIGITNPITSNRTMYLERIIAGDILSPINQLLSYDSGIRMKIVSNPSIVESRLIEKSNLNLGYRTNSQIQACRISAFSGGTEIVRTANVAGHISIEFNGQIIVPPGHSIAIIISNELSLPGRTIIGDITIIWYELNTP